MTEKSIELAGDSDVKPTACDPQYDYAHVTIVRGPTKPSTVGLSPEMHSYSRLRQENGTVIGENPKYVSTPGGGGGYSKFLEGHPKSVLLTRGAYYQYWLKYVVYMS